MSGFKEKAQVFIIGLAIGLLVAGAFFILKLDDYIKELSIYKNVTQTFSSEEKTAAPPEKTASLETGKKSGTKKNKEEKAVEERATEENTAERDTLKAVVVKDSVNAEFTAGDDIVVRKDELLSTKTMDVFNLNATANRTTAKDSLLQRISGIKDDKNSEKQMFNVEFWSSPLNYKGYKLGKYKMVLYGIASADGLKIYKLDDEIYLKYQSLVYHLEYSADFRQYERITDESIISKLK